MTLNLNIREDYLNTLKKKWKDDSKSCKEVIHKYDIVQLPTRKSKHIDLLSALGSSRSLDTKIFLREIIYKIIIQNVIYKDFSNLSFLGNYEAKDLILKGLEFDDIVSEREQEKLVSTRRTSMKQDLLFAIELGSRVDINRFSFDEVVELLHQEDPFVTVFARYILMRFPKERLNGNKLVKLYEEYHKNLLDACKEFNSIDYTSLDAIFNAWHIDLQLVLEDLLLEKFPNHIPNKILMKFSQSHIPYIRSQAIAIKKRDYA